MNNKSEKIINILERITSDKYDINTHVKLTSAQVVALQSFCEREEINFNYFLAVKGHTVNDCLNIYDSDKSNEKIPFNYNDDTNFFEQNKIGCDIQSIEEFNKLIETEKIEDSIFVLDNFHKNEIDYALTKSNPLETFTGIFAAKESIFKINNKFQKIKNINITYLEGKPHLSNYSISISHSKNYVFAVAINLKNYDVSITNSKNWFKINFQFLFNLFILLLILIIFKF